MTILTEATLWREALSEPLAAGCTELWALSGYASPAVLYDLLAQPSLHPIQVRLIVGMVVQDGISLGAHRGFVALQTEHHPGRAFVRYVVSGQPVHTKLYVWCRNGVPYAAFAGSANLTRNGFSGGYQEVLVPAEPEAALALIRAAAERAVPCDSPAVPHELVVLSAGVRDRARGALPSYRPWRPEEVPSVDISLLNARTSTGVAFGLNWGHRGTRNRDESYLPVPRSVASLGFLPPRGQRFTLLSADGQALSAVVAQDGDKAIETPDSNAILGRFIRSQLRIPPGTRITAAELAQARVTGYRLSKLDDETFAVEFGPYG